jgi:hypothetical protein
MRPGITWVIVGAVVVVGVFAGLDALRSSGGEPTRSEASATVVTTTQTGNDAEVASSRELRAGRVVKLIPGRVAANDFFEMDATFTVPPGWYGYQGAGFFLLGKRLSPAAVGVDYASGGIIVDALPRSLASAARSLETAVGIRVFKVSRVSIGGYSGRQYGLVLRRPASLQDGLGYVAELEPGEPDVILLGVRGRTIVIRRGFDQDLERPEIERVIRSLRFSQYASGSPQHEIEQTGNEWARLFGAGRRCNRYMGQPACEWVACASAGAGPIPNCTPVSSKVQRSFRRAVVEDIVIRGQRAAARFSNGETVRFQENLGFWGIERVGAGQRLFE